MRERFVKRARFLKEHGPFQQALTQVVEEWNSEYPAFAIKERGIPPSEEPWAPIPSRSYPPALLDAGDIRRDHQESGASWTDADEGLLEAAARWEAKVIGLCRQWWPEEYFPNWLASNHLAERFVSACLLWDPQLVPEEWVGRFGLPLRGISYKLGGPDAAPAARIWKAAFGTVLNRWARAVSDGTPITLDSLRRIGWEAI